MNKKVMWIAALLLMITAIAIAEIVKDVPVSTKTYEYLAAQSAATGQTPSVVLGTEVDAYVAQKQQQENVDEFHNLVSTVRMQGKEKEAIVCLKGVVE